MSSDRHPAHAEAAPEPASLRRLWTLFCVLADCWRRDSLPQGPAGLVLTENHRVSKVDRNDRAALLVWDERGLHAGAGQPPPAHDLVALYAPFFPAEPDASMIIAHLGQSIDAQIATRSGDSCFVNGPANIVHLHRLRALCDAVIVGVGTAVADNPRLTTRLVEGDNPVRVVIDPNRRAPPDLRLFNDGEAPSLLACAADCLTAEDAPGSVIGVPREGDGLALSDLVAALQARGLRRLFVEGGGITVSRWMTAGLLDRLHVTVAPLFIGEGRPALQLPAATTVSACRRPPARVFRLGDDLLWDFDLLGDDHCPPDRPDEPAFWPSRVR